MLEHSNFFSAIRRFFLPNSSVRRIYPPAPQGWVFFVIPDIHGRSDCLDKAHAAIDLAKKALPPAMQAAEIYLGDLVDRGHDSAGVLGRIIQRTQNHTIYLIKGNHEIMMEAFLDGSMSLEEWKPFGGIETLLSYGLEPSYFKLSTPSVQEKAVSLVPSAHRMLLAYAKPYLHFGDYCFVHAGIRPGIALSDQKLDDLTWIRQNFLDYEDDFGFIVVHGHTPVPEVDFRNNRINLDKGAYITNYLSILQIDDKGAHLLEY